MTEPEKESEKQQGISKEAWAAISAIAVALIGGIVAIFTAIYSKTSSSPSPSTSPSQSPTTSSSSSTSPSQSSTISSSPSETTPVPTVPPSPSPSAQKLSEALDTVNIDFSEPKLRDFLGNSFSNYPQFAEGCLKLLNNQRLKKKVYFDVIFWNYTQELGGKVTSDSPDGDLDTNILKAAMIRAYNTRNGSNALSFGDIVKPKIYL
ncbi:MAG: hypothetical protein KME28_16375 [Pelatocladus maniniholoensis HA4357-MV3]|jgi:hypothetical protein|uniref:Uncharacterized protein n=1 Tax=Pelatocladus maniniholoensis HA4357-MV3 TaxID=1117104 RepID=A0A9E3H9F9_9NOST|nr:hypothetical protein [Pelatocladus maniniholoensis HA4357-MV3]